MHGMREQALRGWYTGDEATLMRFGAWRDIIARTNPELRIRLCLTRDKMHHSVGWWRNAEYELCWHLSISAWDRQRRPEPEDIPPEEERYWSFAAFPQNTDKLWHEPGGTDPRLTPTEKMRHRHFAPFFALAVQMDPYTPEPFRCPSCGEGYPLRGTCWGFGADKHPPVQVEAACG